MTQNKCCNAPHRVSHARGFTNPHKTYHRFVRPYQPEYEFEKRTKANNEGRHNAHPLFSGEVIRRSAPPRYTLADAFACTSASNMRSARAVDPRADGAVRHPTVAHCRVPTKRGREKQDAARVVCSEKGMERRRETVGLMYYVWWKNVKGWGSRPLGSERVNSSSTRVLRRNTLSKSKRLFESSAVPRGTIPPSWCCPWNSTSVYQPLV